MKRSVAVQIIGVLMFAAAFTENVQAEIFRRWTPEQGEDSRLMRFIAEINKDSPVVLTESDFTLGEDRTLAFSTYQRWDQVRGNARIKHRSIRIWRQLKSDRLIQAEASIDDTWPGDTESGALSITPREKDRILADVRRLVRNSDDHQIRNIASEILWQDRLGVFSIDVKSRRGIHHFVFSLADGNLLEHSYENYPHADLRHREIAIPAKVFPVYEEYKSEALQRVPVLLKYLSASIQVPEDDPFLSLAARTYPWRLHDSVRGNTADGQAAGYWSMEWLQKQIRNLQAEIPWRLNRFSKGPVLLQGRYATINIHPQAFDAFNGVTIPKAFSGNVAFLWSEDIDNDDYVVKPAGTYFGKPLTRYSSAWYRDATRHPEHDPATYLNSGFDELQVYYAINELFDSLRPRGFTDPDLGDRPFHAVLFDPDIESQDNAYYTDDTINFTTYSREALNYARDNTTIWHELGHGVMDRLMGSRLNLDDTGGLSEGMADFVAALVLQASYGSKAFPGRDDQRIINDIGFFLTNEVHDDGEAYGGTMRSVLDLSLARFGETRGLHMVTDLVLEAMRLSRDHPHLTAEDWFERMRFADSLGRTGVRVPGEMSALISEALAARNFANAADRARFAFAYNGNEVDSEAPGSRGRDIKLDLTPDAAHELELKVSVTDGVDYKFIFPVIVKVFFNSGPLQGAVDWVGEDTEPAQFVINSSGEILTLPLKVNGTCDQVNRSDGSCSDFAYVQIWNAGETRPVAKKRFYVRIKNPAP